MKKIWLAGGCFWGVEAYFQQFAKVVDTTVGYGQGVIPNPSYEAVCTGTTGHAEICEVVYDEKKLPLDQLLEAFFRIIDPTVKNRQGNDVGTQYRTGIYYNDPDEQAVIEQFLQKKQIEYARPIVVEVKPLRSFYPAEEYHQDYLKKNPSGYCHIDLDQVTEQEKN
ncbi:MAG: peptide-methionine (S)-S-oxide reductase MsrA [Sporomusaceae bacterium]|nr:peptide-methionine (S)-S-oxide reductase MsrA [Sporomusaceae bacterium]